jgi:hypothetical protein
MGIPTGQSICETKWNHGIAIGAYKNVIRSVPRTARKGESYQCHSPACSSSNLFLIISQVALILQQHSIRRQSASLCPINHPKGTPHLQPRTFLGCACIYLRQFHEPLLHLLNITIKIMFPNPLEPPIQILHHLLNILSGHRIQQIIYLPTLLCSPDLLLRSGSSNLVVCLEGCFD